MSAVDTEDIAAHALGCWQRVTHGTRPIELYVRVSERRRVERSAVREIHDAGIAVRAFFERRDSAGFAARVGFSDAAIASAVRMATARQHPVSEGSPEGRDPSQRSSDLDPPLALPAIEELRSWAVRDGLEWIEAGITSEVLIGPSGWVATRRRHRIWARTLEEPQRLLARRATSKWDHALVDLPAVEISSRSQWLALLPEAVAPILSLLVRRCGGKLPSTWSITDEPTHPAGLVGGCLDDAGFETRTTSLRCTSPNDSGGFFQRRSFRDPPAVGLSNLVVDTNDNEDRPIVSDIASGGRVVSLGPDDWVVELDLRNGEKRRLRSSPSVLAASVGATFGSSRSTPDGPIVPGILLDAQTLVG